jgi:hypothetical protein
MAVRIQPKEAQKNKLPLQGSCGFYFQAKFFVDLALTCVGKS